MCKYEYKEKTAKLKDKAVCIYPKVYQDLKNLNSGEFSDIDLSLPLDEEGFCIFHSSNLEWKNENNFSKRFLDLLKVLNQQASKRKINKERRGTFDFSGFIFSGKDNVINFSELQFLENPKFRNAIFNEKLLLSNTHFVNGCQFENANFYKNVEIRNTKFSDTAFFDESIFHADFDCVDSKFENFVIFTSSIFRNIFTIQKCTFDNFVMFDKLKFESKSAWACFDYLTFNEYATVDFSHSKFDGLVRFKEIIFNANVNFNNCDFSLTENANPLKCSVSFEKNKIGNNALIQFKGDETYYRMFKNDVSFTFKDEIVGKVYFVNVDLGSLDYRTVTDFKLLEEKKQLEIGNGCIRDKMNKVNIFIASQEILKPERDFIEIKIEEKNPVLKTKYIVLQPIRWEKRDKGNDGTRKQDEYNTLISNSEVVILILWNSVGKYSNEEYDYAYLNMKAGKNPRRIYIFNKINNNGFDNMNKEETFPNFLNKLAKDEMFIVNFSEISDISKEINYMCEEIEKKYKR